MQARWSLLLLAALLMCAGCPRSPTTNNNKTPPQPLAAPADDTAATTVSATKTADDDQQAANDKSSSATDANTTSTGGTDDIDPATPQVAESTTANPDQAASPAADPIEEDVAAERILLLPPAGPVLIDVRLTIDGKPHQESMSSLIREVRKEADANGDSQLSWDEITKDSSLRLGNLVTTDEAERLRLIQMYDYNGNQQAEDDELRRYLTRNAGASKSFNMRSSNYYRDINRWESAVRMLLDEDGDRALSAEEIAGASVRLRSRDGDADDLLLVGDFLDESSDSVNALQMQRTSVAESAFHLNDVRDWSHVLYALEEAYALGRPLEAGTPLRDPELFAALDANNDQRINTKEILRLLEVPPQVIISASFGNTGDTKTGPASLEVVGQPHIPDLVVSQPSDDRLAIALPDVNLIIFVRDDVAIDFLAQARQQVQMFDANNDGYLEADEYPEAVADAVGGFDTLDVNDDGKLYPEEIARVFEMQGAANRSQLRSRAGEDRDALFAALDQDLDGRLVAREILGAAQRLASMDRNGDSQLSIDEIPSAMLLGVVRGDPQTDDQMFQPRPAAPRRTDAPDWFVAMDTNRDGEVSRSEFLGSLDDFQKLDADGNGFLDAQEGELAAQ